MIETLDFISREKATFSGDPFPLYQLSGPEVTLEQVMGVEPTSSAWKADALTVVLHLQRWEKGGNQRGAIKPLPEEYIL